MQRFVNVDGIEWEILWDTWKYEDKELAILKYFKNINGKLKETITITEYDFGDFGFLFSEENTDKIHFTTISEIDIQKYLHKYRALTEIEFLRVEVENLRDAYIMTRNELKNNKLDYQYFCDICARMSIQKSECDGCRNDEMIDICELVKNQVFPL